MLWCYKTFNMNIDTQLKVISLNIHRDIEHKCNNANAFLDLKFNKLIKEFGFTNTEKIKRLKIKNVISDIEIIQTLLKKRGYVKYGDIYTKGFVFVTFGDEKELKQINVKHDINGSKWHVINESFVTGLVVALNYFERA